MPTLKEAQDQVISLSQKALDLVENPDVEIGEKKTQLDKIETDIKKWEDEVSVLSRFEDHKKRVNAANGFVPADGAETKSSDGEQGGKPARLKSLGQQFTEHAGYAELKGTGTFSKAAAWTTGEIELKDALSEGVTNGDGTGYALVQTPQVLPGLVQTLFQPLTISALIPEGSVSGPLLRYLVEQTVTNAAGTVAEGGLYPESELTFSKVDDSVRKIATFLPVDDEMLEDVGFIRSYIDARLQLFIQIEEEHQLLRGDGTDENLVGFLNRTGLAATISKGTSPSASDDNNMDAIYRQITAIRTTAFLEPESTVIDPKAWETITLSKDTMGRYLAAGPFMSVQAQTLWGKPVTVTTAMPDDTALVGAFRQASQKFRRGGLAVEASNSHQDYFQRGKVAIRARERLALAVYRPGAFGIVDSLA